MKFEKLNGLIAAPFTPMHGDGSLNTALIPQYYRLLKENGVKGAFICGSTGEGVSMTAAEKMEVMDAWADCAGGDEAFTVMPLLGGTSLRDCRELALHAKTTGMDAVSFTAPFYFRPASVDILAKACMEVASVVPDLPFYYYHIPVLTGVNFPMIDLLQEVNGKIPNFAGIKYTHEDFMDFLSCLRYDNGRFDMLWGRDENMLPALSLGAKASVGSTYNYAAPLYHRLMDAFDRGDLDTARDLQQVSIDMIRLLGKYGGIATGKAYMKLVGLDCGQFRLPVKNMESQVFDLFRKDTEAIGFGRFSSRMPSAASA